MSAQQSASLRIRYGALSRRKGSASIGWPRPAPVLIAVCLPLLSTCGRRHEAVIAFYRQPAVFAQVAQSAKDWKTPDGDQIRFLELHSDATDSLEEDIQLAQRLVSMPGVIAVVGHDDSRGSLLAAPVYNEAGVLQIVPTANSSRLRGCGEWTFMLAPTAMAEGLFIASFVADTLHARSISVFYHADEYGIELRDGVVAGLEEQNLRVIDQVPFDWMNKYPPGQEVFASVVEASLRRGVPDVAVIAGRSREAGQLARLIHARAPDVVFVAGDAVEPGDAFFATAGGAAVSFNLATFWNQDSPDPISQEFVERSRQVTGRAPTASDAMHYDAAMLLAEAARSVGSDRNAVRRYLTEIGVSRPPYHGVTGDISFAPGAPNRLTMTRIRGDRTYPAESEKGGN